MIARRTGDSGFLGQSLEVRLSIVRLLDNVAACKCENNVEHSIRMPREGDQMVAARPPLPSVATAYERRLAKLEREKLVTQENLAKKAEPAHSFDQLFELACQFLASPWKLWESGQLTLQRTVLKLAFAERIAYCRKTGLRTPQTTLPFKVLAGVQGQKCEMAGRQGFEPWERSHVQRFSRPPHSTTLPPPRSWAV